MWYAGATRSSRHCWALAQLTDGPMDDVTKATNHCCGGVRVGDKTLELRVGDKTLGVRLGDNTLGVRLGDKNTWG